MWLQVRMYLLIGVLFGLLYALITGIAVAVGGGGFILFFGLAAGLVLIQYLIGPLLVSLVLQVRYVTEQEEPELHRMVGELAQEAGIPKPKVGISEMTLPNAFAFGRTRRDARVCVTDSLRRLLSKDELRAVLGHEISHIKHRDMAIITVLSVVPLVFWYVAWGLMLAGTARRRGGYLAPAAVAFILYFVTNLLVLYGSRIREYYADLGSVEIGNRPHQLASALYRLVYADASAPKEAVRQVVGLRAFFVNDPSRAGKEIRELKEIDRDMSGAIDSNELVAVRTSKMRLGISDRILELWSTHPNMLKRIKHLASLSPPSGA